MGKTILDVTSSGKKNKKKKFGKQEKKRFAWAYILILPQVIFFLVFTIYPMVMSYVYSAYKWIGVGPLDNFVGFKNYLKVLNDEMYWNAFQNTIIYMLGLTIILMPCSLIMAVLLNNVLKKSSVFYRTVYFLPVVTTTAIVGIVLRHIFAENGFLNEILLSFNILDQPYPWLTSSTSAMVIVILTGAWKFFGMMMIYWLAGLQTLPKDVVEAAKIDGCNNWNLIRRIIIPILMPVGTVILLLCVTSSLHVFDMVITLTKGGPYYSTDMVDLFIYRNAFEPTAGMPDMGYASAAGVVFGFTTLVIVLILGWLVRRAQKKNN